MKPAAPLARKSDIVIQQLDDETLIYDLLTNRAFCLNNTSSFVWQMCDGSQTVDEMSRKLGEHLKTSPDTNIVWLALEQLKKDDLLANAESVDIHFGGLSRREAIRKVGFASLVLLPAIASLAAPAAAAQISAACGADPFCQCPSGTPVGDDCGNGQVINRCTSPGCQTCISNAFACGITVCPGHCTA